MSEQVLGKRTRSASPPTGDASGQPEAKRSTNATSPVENSADVPIGVANGASAEAGEEESDDDDIGPMPDAPGEGNEEAVKGKKKTKKAGEFDQHEP
jgi:PPE-repeat protein